MYILGINAFHGDSSACLLKDGELVSAIEEERLRRVKHWAGLPTESIKWCLKNSNINLNEIQHIALNQNTKANLDKKLLYLINHPKNLSKAINSVRRIFKRSSIIDQIQEIFPGSKFLGEIQFVDHHLAHIASSYYVSPFKEAVVLSVDGFGDFASASWGIASSSKIEIHDKVFFPHSLGIFYQSLTQYIGFNNYGDEYKVMGLAPYGNPSLMHKMNEIISLKEDGKYELNLDYFRHHNENIKYQWENGSPSVDRLFSDKLCNLFGSPREPDKKIEQLHKDLAHCTQLLYEKAFLNLIRKLYDKYKLDKLALSGGCAMNSVANGKIIKNSKFNSIYIQSAAGDAGGAIGAAYFIWHKLNKFSINKNNSGHFHAYWGPSYSNSDISSVIKEFNSQIMIENCEISFKDNFEDILDQTAMAISKGKIVGWFQGAMEWGPRALGNRSIIGDPRNKNMQEILNLKIKLRESFRPFAPSIIREKVLEWFEQDGSVPFMSEVYKIRVNMRKFVPAITHVDGTGRLQTVEKTANEKYYNLIKKFYEITNVPILLNTSFNENEPIVCNPKEALNTFLRTKMDFLVMENWIIKRI